jgi:hypothetical protein
MPRPIQKTPLPFGTTLALPPAWPRAGAPPNRRCAVPGRFGLRGKEEAMKLVLILTGLIGLYALLLRTGNPTAALVLTTAAGVIAAVIAGLMREASDF